MSRWQEESGTLKFTKTGYQILMRELRTRFNARQAELLEIAKAAHECLAPLDPAQRNEMSDLLFSRGELSSKVDRVEGEIIKAELFRGKNGALTQPRASAFLKLKNTQREFSIEVGSEGASLTLNDSELTLRWSVDEGNRSVDRTENSLGYARYIDYLENQYPWKKGEGGCFTVQEEDLSDDEDSSGTISYVSSYFGSVGVQMKKDDDQLFDLYLTARRTR